AGVNVIEMDSGTLQIPTVTDDGAASVVAEGAAIPLTDMQVADTGFKAHKIARGIKITSELLEDSAADARQAVSDALTRSVATAVDDYFFNGTGVNQPLGILKAPGVVSTPLSAPATLDNIADEMAAIEAYGGTVKSILVDPQTFNAIRKMKASGSGVYHSSPFVATDGPSQAWGAQLIGAPRLPAGTVVLMDPAYIHVGLRRNVMVAYSDQVLFMQDSDAAKITTRWAGVGLADPKAVRVLTKAV
ncbi:phage major capsid protein, partial [Streptomyces roseifaciens]